jgi:hypothetical protein
MNDAVKSELDVLSLAVFRRHPIRMLWWYVAEWGVKTSLGLQDSIEAKNRESLAAHPSIDQDVDQDRVHDEWAEMVDNGRDALTILERIEKCVGTPVDEASPPAVV